MSTAIIAPTGTWNVDPAHSRVGFSVKHLGIATVRGYFREFEGTIEIGDDITAARAYGTVKTASIDTGDETRDNHLRSPEFFDAENHPELTFESTRIESTGDGGLKVTGNLTIRGITREVELEADVNGTETDPWGNERVGLEAQGQISRSVFGMKFALAGGSGNLVVGDKVKLDIDVSAVKAS